MNYINEEQISKKSPAISMHQSFYYYDNLFFILYLFKQKSTYAPRGVQKRASLSVAFDFILITLIKWEESKNIYLCIHIYIYVKKIYVFIFI